MPLFQHAADWPRLSLFVRILAGVVVLLGLAFMSSTAPPADAAIGPNARLDWTPRTVGVSINAGDVVTTTVRLKVSAPILSPFLQVRSPNGISAMKFDTSGLPEVLVPDVTYELPLVIKVGHQFRGNQIAGRAYLSATGRTYGPPLRLSVSVRRASPAQLVLTPRPPRFTQINLLDYRMQLTKMTSIAESDLVWVNYGQTVHRLKSDELPTFASGDIPPSGRFTIQLTERGEFLYFCVYHRDRGMEATMRVK